SASDLELVIRNCVGFLPIKTTYRLGSHVHQTSLNFVLDP
ncbi:unnamed protein product, partial [Tenebrio molitor]